MLYKCVVLCVLVQLCVGKRVLVVFPVASRSHTLLGDHVVKTLLNGGHNVTYITTRSRVKASASDRLRVIDIPSSANDDDTEPKDKFRLSELASARIPSHQFLKDGTRSAEITLRHPEVQALMKDSAEDFDVVIADWYYSGLLAPLAAVFECPLVWYSAVDAFWMNLQLVHEPSSPAYSVDLMATSLPTLPPSVADRAYRIGRQAYLSAWVYYTTYYVETPLYYEIYHLAIQQRGRTPAFYDDLVNNGSMLLVNSHPVLGQGLPLPQNAKYIGGHHVQGSAGSLPKNLQAVLDSAKYGVIYFNLGSTVSEDLPPEMKQQLLRTFRQVEQTVVWKYRGKLDYVPGNVHLVEQVSHQAVLKHPNTVMIITNGGHLSYMEAIYQGVPIIGIPIEEDQFLTMDIVTTRGHGIRVPYSWMIGYKMKEAIIEILGNYSYELTSPNRRHPFTSITHVSASLNSTTLQGTQRPDTHATISRTFNYQSNSKQASAILQQSLVPVDQEMLYWIELVMSTGGATHLRSSALQLSMMERFNLDVVAVVIMLAWFFSKVAKLVKVYWDDYETDCDDIKKNE